jgi:hypothetical protein
LRPTLERRECQDNRDYYWPKPLRRKWL